MLAVGNEKHWTIVKMARIASHEIFTHCLMQLVHRIANEVISEFTMAVIRESQISQSLMIILAQVF